MRFPWLQVGADVISAKAGDLGILLGCSRREAMGLLVDLWAWVLTRSPDGAPPDGIVRDSRTGTGAVPATERAGAWAGPDGMLVTALEELGFVERLSDGLRFRGVERYAATWEKNRRRRGAGDKPERTRSGAGEEPARKTQTQTQTQTQKEEKQKALSATADLQAPLLQVAPVPAETPEDLQALWNREAHGSLPRWQGMSDARKRRAAARLRERPLAQWQEIILRLSASPFCRGEGDGKWRASPDWMLQPDVADKVLEGKYDRVGGTVAGAVEAPVGEECAVCSVVGDGANLQQPGGGRLWLGYACGCCSGWTAEVQTGRHYGEVYEWAHERRVGRVA